MNQHTLHHLGIPTTTPRTAQLSSNYCGLITGHDAPPDRLNKQAYPVLIKHGEGKTQFPLGNCNILSTPCGFYLAQLDCHGANGCPQKPNNHGFFWCREYKGENGHWCQPSTINHSIDSALINHWSSKQPSTTLLSQQSWCVQATAAHRNEWSLPEWPSGRTAPTQIGWSWVVAWSIIDGLMMAKSLWLNG